jgi:O-antigen ligase
MDSSKKKISQDKNSCHESISLSFLMLCFFTLANYFSPQYYFGVDNIPIYFGFSAAIFVIIERRLKNDVLLKLSSPLFFLFFVYMFALYSTFVQTVDIYNSKDIFFYFSKSIALFILIAAIINTKKKIKYFYILTTLCAFYLSIRMLHYQYWDGGRPFVSGTYFAADPNDFSVVIIYTLPLTVALLLIYKNLIFRIFLIYAIFIMFLGIIEAQSRGGFVALIASFFMLLFLIKGVKYKIIGTMIIIILFGGFVARYASELYIFRMKEIISPEADATGSAKIREYNMRIIFEYIISNPFSEYGLGNHSYHLASIYSFSPVENGADIHRGSTLVHSFFVQFGGDTGLVPMFFYICFFISVFYVLNKSQKIFISSEFSEKKEMVLMTKALIVAMTGFTAGSFFLPMAYRMYLFYISGLSVAVYSISLREKSRQERR